MKVDEFLDEIVKVVLNFFTKNRLSEDMLRKKKNDCFTSAISKEN